MTTVTRRQFKQAIVYGTKFLDDMGGLGCDINCAFHFSAEFGDVALMRKIGGDLNMGIIIDGKPAAIFQMRYNDDGNPFWTKFGEGENCFWTKDEIYDNALDIANKMTKEAAK